MGTEEFDSISSLVAVVKNDVHWLRGEVQDIKDNHLKHLHRELEKVHERINSHRNWQVGTLTAIVLLLFGVLVNIFIK